MLKANIMVVEAPEFLTPEAIVNAAGFGFSEIHVDAACDIVFDDEHGATHLLHICGLKVNDEDYEFGSMDVQSVLAESCPNGPCEDCDDLGYIPLDIVSEMCYT